MLNDTSIGLWDEDSVLKKLDLGEPSSQVQTMFLVIGSLNLALLMIRKDHHALYLLYLDDN